MMVFSRLNARAVCLVAFLLITGEMSLAADKQEPPTAEEILRKVLERAKADKAKQKEIDKTYAFTQRVLTEKLDSDGTVKEHTEKLYEVSPVDGTPTPRLIQKNGKPPSAADLQEEKEQLKKTREREQKSKHSDEDVEFDEELVGKYLFERLGEETLDGRAAFVLAFKPRSKDMPTKRKADYVLNRVAGRAWIDEQDYEITRIEFRLTEPTKILGGILASIKDFNGSFEQSKVGEGHGEGLGEGVWFPKYFNITLDARVLFTSVHQKQEVWLSNVRRVAPQRAGVSEPLRGWPAQTPGCSSLLMRLKAHSAERLCASSWVSKDKGWAGDKVLLQSGLLPSS